MGCDEDVGVLIARAERAEVDDPRAACALYLRVRERAPWHAAAGDGISRCYRATEQWDQLTQWLLPVAKATRDPAERAQRYRELAALYQERLGDRPAATESLRAAVAADPHDGASWAELARLLVDDGADTEAMAALDGVVAATREPRAQATACAEVAQRMRGRGPDSLAMVQAVARRGLRLWPAHAGCQELLEELLEADGAWTELVQTCLHHASCPPDAARRRAALVRAGDTLAEWLDEPERAATVYEEVLVDTPEDAGVLARAARAWEAAGNEARALEYYERTALVGSAEQRAAAYVAAGELHRARGDHRFEALACFRRALDLSPGDPAALDPLVEALLESQQIDDLVMLLAGLESTDQARLDALDRVLRDSTRSEHSTTDQADWWFGAATAASRLHAAEVARNYYESALRLDPARQDALVALARLLEAAGDSIAAKQYWARAIEHFESNDPQWCEAGAELARLELATGAPDVAQTLAEAVYEEWPDYEPNLLVLEQVYAFAEQPAELAEVKASLCAVDPANVQRFVELGHLCIELDDRAGAIAALDAAAQRLSDPKAVLLTLLEQCGAAQAWDRVLSTLAQLVRVDADEPGRELRYRWAAVEVARDHLGDHATAIEHLEAILARDEQQWLAYEQLEELYAKRDDVTVIERLYRRELAVRGQDEPARRLALWRKLATIHDERLDDAESALAAYEAVLGLDPTDAAARDRVVGLYDRLVRLDFARYGGAAVQRHHQRLRAQPHAADSLHALFELYRRGGDMDKAYCAASVLAVLRQASTSQLDVVQRFRPHELATARVALPDALLRKHLLGAHLDAGLFTSFHLLGPAVTTMAAKKLPADLRRAAAIIPAQSDSSLGRFVDYTRRVLGVVAPTVYVRASLDADYHLASLRAADEVSPVLQIDADVTRRRAAHALAFDLGRELIALYPALWPYFALGRSLPELRRVVAAARLLAGHESSAEKDVEQLARRLHPAVPSSAWPLLRDATRAVRADLEALEQFAIEVERVAVRAGLVLCGDVAAAADAVAQGRSPPAARLDRRGQLREVLTFGSSEDYFVLRQRLGIGQDTPLRRSSRGLPRPASLS